jgi:hypothetical protein
MTDYRRGWKLCDLADARRASKPWLPEDDRDVTNGLVALDEHGLPACAAHGAMHRVDQFRPVYRCSEFQCGVGAEMVPVTARAVRERSKMAGNDLADFPAGAARWVPEERPDNE